MARQKTYEKPKVETLRAEQILETLGPVSCGSNVKLAPSDSLFENQ